MSSPYSLSICLRNYHERLLQIGSLLMCSLTDSALDPSLRVEHVRLTKKEVFNQKIRLKKDVTDLHRLLARNAAHQSVWSTLGCGTLTARLAS